MAKLETILNWSVEEEGHNNFNMGEAMGMVCPSEAIPLTIDPRLSRQTKGEPWFGEANIAPTEHDAPKR